MTDEQKARCRGIAAHYGIGNQKYKACEEMAELIQAIMKTETEKIEYKHFELLVEEIANVCIMMEQLRFFFGELDVDKAITSPPSRGRGLKYTPPGHVGHQLPSLRGKGGYNDRTKG